MQTAWQLNDFSTFFSNPFGNGKKDARLEAKLNASQKEILQKVAALQGLDLASFVISAALEKARNVVKESSALYLDDKEYEKFMLLLKQETKASVGLKNLMKLEDIHER